MDTFLFYLKLGWEHIISLDALDHQLFILVLIAAYSYKEWKKILILVTAFTIGHSITLALSILDIVRIPSDLIEILIPVTIIITAIGNIFTVRNQKNQVNINYFLALFFGLIHGMGFANTARVMISSEENIGLPLLGFNIGLELGQIVVVFLVLTLYFLISKFIKFNSKYWVIGISAITILLSLKMIFERI